MRKVIEWSSDSWNDEFLYLKYKKTIFEIEVAKLSERTQINLSLYDPSKFRATGTAILKGRNIVFGSIKPIFSNYGIPTLLIDHKLTKTSYIEYSVRTKYGWRFFEIQRNGFLVYCAPTGQGKTYFALSNLCDLASQFDTLLYINLELSIDDIKQRCLDMKIEIPKNVYVAPLDNVDVIEKWAEGKGSCVFVIDNIDNLVGGGLDPFGEQLNFIKKLDRFLKDNNHHALVLTQLVKENNINLLGKDGQINDGITPNILSGVKQLSYLSRSVIMTAYSPELDLYVYKFLKVGSGRENVTKS